jgi:sulfatase modifying factor 1
MTKSECYADLIERSVPSDNQNHDHCLAKADTERMVWIPGGAFLMGSDKFYREERPVRPAHVEGFWMDRFLVTNADFAAFVEATGYLTFAERMPSPEMYPDADPSLLVPGSSVFAKPKGPVSLSDYRAWWSYVPGACWCRPEGPGSSIEGRAKHPVVHIAYEDALAYAGWIGKALPLETEWEYAARGGLDGANFPWGDEPYPDGRHMANTWQGRFPWENTGNDGYEGTSPVGAFPPNGYGLFDAVGNVWEWTASPYRIGIQGEEQRSCCSTGDASNPQSMKRVVKGGSHLCAPNYCLRFRPAARQGEAIDTSTSHIGFRCIRRP